MVQISSLIKVDPSITLTSVAYGSWGCGAFTSGGQLFQLQLPGSWQEVHIVVKELLPIVLGVAVWGNQWQGLAVSCRCDNVAVVAIVTLGGAEWT